MDAPSPSTPLSSPPITAPSAAPQAPAAVAELAGGEGATLQDPIPVNPPTDEALLMRQQLMARRAAAKAKKDGKKASKALAAAVPGAVASALAAVQAGGGASASLAASLAGAPAAAKSVQPQKRNADVAVAAHTAEEQVRSPSLGTGCAIRQVITVLWTRDGHLVSAVQSTREVGDPSRFIGDS